MIDHLTPDYGRAGRIGVEEAIVCEGKTVEQVGFILDDPARRGNDLLLTGVWAATEEGGNGAVGSKEGRVAKRECWQPGNDGTEGMSRNRATRMRQFVEAIREQISVSSGLAWAD